MCVAPPQGDASAMYTGKGGERREGMDGLSGGGWRDE